MAETIFPSKLLWRKYAFYNREMVKFIQKDDIDMFLMLRDQLIEVYGEIEAAPKDGYTETEEGKALGAEMHTNLRFLQLAVQRWINDAKHRRVVSDAYGGLGIPDAGAFKDWNG